MRPQVVGGTARQVAARLDARRASLGGGMRRSAGTRKRARRRCTIAMLSSFLPRRTSLTRLGVPRDHVLSREPVSIYEVADQFCRAWRPSRPLALLIGSDQTRLRLEPSDISWVFRVPQPSTRARARVSSARYRSRSVLHPSPSLRINPVVFCVAAEEPDCEGSGPIWTAAYNR